MQDYHTCHLEADLKNKVFFYLAPTWGCILNWILTAHALYTTQFDTNKSVPLSDMSYEPQNKYLNIWYYMVQRINEVVNFTIFVHQSSDNPLQSHLELQKQAREVVKKLSCNLLSNHHHFNMHENSSQTFQLQQIQFWWDKEKYFFRIEKEHSTSRTYSIKLKISRY